MMGAVDVTNERSIAVLCGGTSAERQISLQSGAAVCTALAHLDVKHIQIDTADGNWLTTLLASEIDGVFIALHGRGGEDGCVQGLLEMLGIPYSGSGVLASALAMDKVRCKKLWIGDGLPTARFQTLHKDTNFAEVIDALGDVIVKPNREGSSLGMSIARNADELQAAFETAVAFDGEVFAEQFITGKEYTVAIVDEKALPVIGLQTGNTHNFYDYDAKYQANDTQYHCPCDLTTAEERDIASLALKAFRSLDCEGWGRVDFMRDAAGRFYLLEVNTVPGMTDHSLVPMAAQAVGMSFEDLIAMILQTVCLPLKGVGA